VVVYGGGAKSAQDLGVGIILMTRMADIIGGATIGKKAGKRTKTELAEAKTVSTNGGTAEKWSFVRPVVSLQTHLPEDLVTGGRLWCRRGTKVLRKNNVVRLGVAGGVRCEF